MSSKLSSKEHNPCHQKEFRNNSSYPLIFLEYYQVLPNTLEILLKISFISLPSYCNWSHSHLFSTPGNLLWPLEVTLYTSLACLLISPPCLLISPPVLWWSISKASELTCKHGSSWRESTEKRWKRAKPTISLVAYCECWQHPQVNNFYSALITCKK